MLEKYPNDVKLVVKHFPLPSHKAARPAAIAALAAHKQDKFWEFHAKLLENYRSLDDKKIEEIEYMIYKKWFDEFLDDLPEIRLVYAKTDPKVASCRVEKRAREGETIPLSYLENCHKYHEDWLMNHDSSHLLVLDANVDTAEFPSVTTSWVSDIEKFILPIKSDSDKNVLGWEDWRGQALAAETS